MATTDPATDAQTQASAVAYPLDEPGRVATPERRLRRELLKGAVGAVIGAAVVYTGWTRYLFPPAPPAPRTGVPLGRLADFPAGGPPKVVTGRGTTRPYAVENTGGTFRVLSAVCTHNGCPVAWQAGANAFVCPCHGARFDVTGKVTQGPAARPLETIPAHVSRDTLYAQG